MNTKHQTPSALCASPVKRARRDPHLTFRLRRQFLSPGHHMMVPVKQTVVTAIAPKPFTTRPFLSEQQVFVKLHQPLDREPSGQLVAENYYAAGQAHQHDIKTDARSHPQVNLEQSFAYPKPLGVLQPLLEPVIFVVLANYGFSPGVCLFPKYLRKSSRPTREMFRSCPAFQSVTSSDLI